MPGASLICFQHSREGMGRDQKGERRNYSVHLETGPGGSGPVGKEAGRVRETLLEKSQGHISQRTGPAVWSEVVLPLLSPIQDPKGFFSS